MRSKSKSRIDSLNDKTKAALKINKEKRKLEKELETYIIEVLRKFEQKEEISVSG